MTETPQWMKLKLNDPEIIKKPESIDELKKNMDSITGCLFGKILEQRQVTDDMQKKMVALEKRVVRLQKRIDILSSENKEADDRMDKLKDEIKDLKRRRRVQRRRSRSRRRSSSST